MVASEAVGETGVGVGTRTEAEVEIEAEGWTEEGLAEGGGDMVTDFRPEILMTDPRPEISVTDPHLGILGTDPHPGTLLIGHQETALMTGTDMDY